MARRSRLPVCLAFTLAGCAQAPLSPDAPRAAKPLEPQKFLNPRKNFADAVRATAEHWHDPALDAEAVYERAWRGLLKELSFQDGETAKRLEAEVQDAPRGKLRFQQGVKAVRRAWAHTGIDDETIYHYALSGLVRDLSWDGEMLQAWPPKYANAAKERLAGDTVSIGLDFKIRQPKLIVTDVVPDSPADRAGIRPGDRIYAIDEDYLGGKGLRDFYEMIRKPAGATVRLLVGRGDTVYRLELACEKFNARDVRSEVLGNVGVIRILNFSGKVVEDYLQQLAALGFRKVDGLVLDLRASGGGLADSIPTVACPFLASGTTLYLETGRDGKEEAIRCPSGGGIDVPAVVLANAETVSAGEFLAVALKENGRARVVGTKTKGYGATKRQVELPNGYTFKIITAANLSPKRNSWLGSGVQPSVELGMSDVELESSRLEQDLGARLKRDVQLAAALELLRRPPP